MLLNKGGVELGIYEMIAKLLLAVIIGGAVGYEREFKNRPAGFRTHILVCIGATVISMIQMYTIRDISAMIMNHSQLAGGIKSDVGRMGAQVISGVGFLGAGTIIHERGSVKGLTTAASLWVVACIGLAIGCGYYYLSISAAFAVVVTLVSLKKLENRFFQKVNVYKIQIDYYNDEKVRYNLERYFYDNNIKVKNIEFLIEEEEEQFQYLSSVYTVLVPRNTKITNVLRDLGQNNNFLKIFLI